MVNALDDDDEELMMASAVLWLFITG